MFNTTNGGYSLADIAAATGGGNNNNDGFGDGGGWWLIVLFLFIFAGGWNDRNGVFGGGGATGSGITDGYILTSDFANIERKIDTVNSGLCDGFYAINTGMLNGFSGVNNAITQSTIADMQNTNAINAGITNLGTQLAQCCCDQTYQTEAKFSALNYNLADQSCQTRQTIENSTRELMANQDANTRSILQFLTQDKIDSLQAENQALKFAASQAAQNTYLVNTLNPAPVPAYVVPSPYAGYVNCPCTTA